MFSKPTDKALALELKGDHYRTKKKFKKAFEAYQSALALNETRVELYDKIIAVHDELKDLWTEDDFTASLHWSLKKQEILDPTFKRIHARSHPEYKEVQILVKKLMQHTTPEKETECVEAIISLGDTALYPLIDVLLNFKELGKKK